jgi:hypothetical protein
MATDTSAIPAKPVVEEQLPANTTLLQREMFITRLMEKRDEYVTRLDIGAVKIEEARAQGKDVSTWEDYWIQLLHQYEAVCDKLNELQTPVVG